MNSFYTKWTVRLRVHLYIQACRVLGLVHNRSMGTTQRDKLDKLYIHVAPGTPLMLTRCPDLHSNPFEGLQSSTR